MIESVEASLGELWRCFLFWRSVVVPARPSSHCNAADAAVAPASAGAAGPTASTTPAPTEVADPATSEAPISHAQMSATPATMGESSSVMAATPAEEVVAQGAVLYRDDFTDLGSGWPDNIEFDNYYIGYHEPNHYHVEVHMPHDRAVVAVPKQTFTDFTMEAQVGVEPNNTAKTGDFRYGLVFRRSGNQYYAFVVSPRTKGWYVLKSSPSGLAVLRQGTVDSIQGLTAEDTLRVDARGPAFFFHINEQMLGQVSDSDYATGGAGFLVETLDRPARAHSLRHDDDPRG